MRKIALVALMAATLAGCATVDGVGQDLSGAARGVQSWF
ncbi:MAG: entericidin EcnA/B family protein [Pseudomonadota bacterium]